MPNSGSDRSVAVDRDAQLSDCVYFQWDTLQQRLHVIQKRPSVLIRTTIANGDIPFVYMAYTINARGQFDSIIKVDFDLRVPPSSLSHGNFEILSSDSSLYLCWQLTMEKETDKAEYAVVSLGHGRTLYISKSLDRANWENYQSRKVHFGLLDGDYVFADLRGEFTHLLNFNVQLNFLNHLFFPNDPTSLPYDTKYTTQRGLINRASTLIYEKKKLFTYTIEISPEKLIKSISSVTIQSIISYALIASKDSSIIQQILEKILFEMYDDLHTKTYLMEILTALIFTRLSKQYHNNKYVLVFPATTVSNRHANVIDVTIQPVAHHREYQPERSGPTNLDQEYHDKLRTSFYHARKYRHKISYYHPIMTTPDNTDSFDDSSYDMGARRPTVINSPPPLISEQRPRSPRFFTFGRRREQPLININPNPADDQRSSILSVKKNDWLFQNVSHELNELHSEWSQERTKSIAFDYVQSTQVQCDYLIKQFTRLAKFDQTQDDDDLEYDDMELSKILFL
jgi:hypothetical protein